MISAHSGSMNGNVILTLQEILREHNKEKNYRNFKIFWTWAFSFLGHSSTCFSPKEIQFQITIPKCVNAYLWHVFQEWTSVKCCIERQCMPNEY